VPTDWNTGSPPRAHAVSTRTDDRTGRRVGCDERVARQGHRAVVVWLTGLPSSGKSTLATHLERALFERRSHVWVLDGDELRRGLSSDLGFSAADRSENIRRAGHVARLFAEEGAVVICAFVSPYVKDREYVRQLMDHGTPRIPFVEVYLDTPVSVCAARDPKGLYAASYEGTIARFTGVSDIYEPPRTPEILLRPETQSIASCLQQVLDVVVPTMALPK
jgi:adenylyl-sulfate kinase